MKVSVPWGTFGLDGSWQHNPLLEMPEAEQRRQNVINGYLQPTGARMNFTEHLTPRNKWSPQNAYAAPKPPPPLLLVYTRKTSTDRLEAFRALGPIKDAIKQVVDGGYPRAMVLVK